MLSNRIAPEHLEIIVNPDAEDQVVNGIENAGALFIGPWSPEPLGDYAAGPNHVLPTSGTARFFSPLSVSDFMKKMSVIRYDRDALNKIGKTVVTLAASESLDCHADAVRVRIDTDFIRMDTDVN